jgi:hypothetical protein
MKKIEKNRRGKAEEFQKGWQKERMKKNLRKTEEERLRNCKKAGKIKG